VLKIQQDLLIRIKVIAHTWIWVVFSFVKFILIFEKQNKEQKITLIFFSEQGKS
jgi:hypothetical protein